MINPKDLRDHAIIPTLDLMSQLYPGINSPFAVNLMLGTASQESTIGHKTYLKQRGGGPGSGIYQIEPATEQSIWIDHLRFTTSARRAMIQGFATGRASAASSGGSQLDLCANLIYQTAIARLKYWYRNFTWPDDPNDIAALGQIWDTHYNGNPDHGTVEQFVVHFPLGVLDQ